MRHEKAKRLSAVILPMPLFEHIETERILTKAQLPNAS